MDLGCIDLGCIEKSNKGGLTNNGDSPKADSNGVKAKKNPASRMISPINWFPRKKVDSFLKRKIQHLQEADGMNLTLDETLGDANPHYSRVLREKMAVREAAYKAMEARKAAMVEASWCRILKAASIESKVAEARLLKAEECAVKAFEAATAIGVIMYDAPDCPTKRYKIETALPNGGSPTHTIKASFETAFEVDKQVAAAVKSAFMKLETCPSIDKDDLKKLLRKISEHPDDTHEHYQEISEFSSDCESDTGTRKDNTSDVKYEKDTPGRQKKQKKRHVLEKFSKENLVDMLLERLKGLPEDELSSLATIVATCGLGAALTEAELGSKLDLESVAENSSTHARRLSSFSAASQDGHIRKKIPDIELPSLDKFLVKRLTRLEREVLEAKNARKSEQKSLENDSSSVENDNNQEEKLGARAKNVIAVPSLDTYLVKHMSRLEKEIQEAKNRQLPPEKENIDTNTDQNDTNRDEDSKVSQNLRSDYARTSHRNHSENSSGFSEGLDKVLVKHVSRLEKEKLRHHADEEIMLKSSRKEENRNELQNGEGGLDQILVKKHKSRLEIEKGQLPETQIRHSSTRRVAREKELQEAWGGLSLGNSMRPNLPKHEKDKQPTEVIRSSARRDAREKELQDTWGGLSLGNSMRPHFSKLQRDKAAWVKAEEEQRREATEV